jgi:hypothetical protein
VRLTGVSVSGLVDGAPEPALFPDAAADKRRKLEELTARIADRFADEHAVTRATLLERPERTVSLSGRKKDEEGTGSKRR